MKPREGNRIRFLIGALFRFISLFRLCDSRDRHAPKLEYFFCREERIERAREARIGRHVQERRDDPLGRDAHVQGRPPSAASVVIVATAFSSSVSPSLAYTVPKTKS